MGDNSSFWAKMFNFKPKKSSGGDLPEVKMMDNIVGLSDTLVKEVMIPRIDMSAIDSESSIQEVIALLEETYHSRYPVYKETVDNVIGVLYTKDLLVALARNLDLASLNWVSLLRKPYFIPESKRLNSLLAEFKKRHVHIAIAVDEYGGVSGIVCLEDIFEEIVGDIQDEFEKTEQDDIVKIEENEYLCDSRTLIEDINEQLDLDLPSDGFGTLGGFLFDMLGKIPSSYEKVQYNNLTFIIQQVEGRKIKTIKVIKENPSLGAENDQES